LQPGINLATYVGATQVRRMVIGNDNVRRLADELKKMTEIVDDAMWTVLWGLHRAHLRTASYAKTGELIALAKVAAKYAVSMPLTCAMR